MYRNEACTLTEREESCLRDGNTDTTKELWCQERWRQLENTQNEESGRIFGELDIVTEIKRNRILYVSHIQWTIDNRDVEKV